jgi:hypothetical protein
LALSEVAAIFPLIKEPDFIVSLGTGTPYARERPFMFVSGPFVSERIKLFLDYAVCSGRKYVTNRLNKPSELIRDITVLILSSIERC